MELNADDVDGSLVVVFCRLYTFLQQVFDDGYTRFLLLLFVYLLIDFLSCSLWAAALMLVVGGGGGG